MSHAGVRRGLYYPFHLCHEHTLQRLLAEYASAHFRDYMALQLTSMTGTTAYMDRMGDRYPELVAAGRIVQGYSVSGPLDLEAASAVNRDLADEVWRDLFHSALVEDRRFQRGLFDFSHAMRIGQHSVPGPAALLRLTEAHRRQAACTLELVKEQSIRPLAVDEAYHLEYGLALVKTSASLVYTVRLAVRYELEAVTDSPAHFQLLKQSCQREGHVLPQRLIARHGYSPTPV